MPHCCIGLRQLLQKESTMNTTYGFGTTLHIPYIILGACNPPLAHRALEQEPGIGLLLPCNVVVRAEGKGSRVEVADPQAMLGIVGNEELNAVAKEAKQRLQRVVASLSGQA